MQTRSWLVLSLSALALSACGGDSKKGSGSGGTGASGMGGNTGAGTTAAGGSSATTVNGSGGSAASGMGGSTVAGTGGSQAGGSDSSGGSGGVGGGGVGGAGGAPPAESGTCEYPAEAELDNAAFPAGFCAWTWADELGNPRGITVDDAGDVLVLTRDDNSVQLLWDEDGDGVSDSSERVQLASESGINHGVAVAGGYLYASSDTTVYRWEYEAGARASLGDSETVVSGIPGGGHSTRTLIFDDEFMYVSVGSGSNVDGDAGRAGIRRFPIADLGDGAIDFETGEWFANGMRNEVGLAFDPQGRLWGVENGRDNLNRDDFSPSDIHQDNPAEELNLFEEPGLFYGYPYCWSEFLLPGDEGLGPGTQWADPNFIDDGTHTDEWCQDEDNVVPPALAMQGHSAPLDLLFYPGGSFPSDYVDDVIVTFHGSWNRDEPTGYKVMHVPFSGGMPSGDPEPLLEFDGDGDFGSGWPHRPVGLATLESGLLLVTSDASDRVIAIGYAP